MFTFDKVNTVERDEEGFYSFTTPSVKNKKLATEKRELT